MTPPPPPPPSPPASPSPHPSPSVRSARPTDASELRALQEHLPEPSPSLLTAAIRELPTAGSDRSGRGLRTTTLLVSADGDDRPVGYLLAVGDEPTHVAELAVDPAHRRAGRATALLESVCDTATEPVTVHVAADNDPARALYRRVGFVETDRSADQFEGSEGVTLRYRPPKNE